MSADNVIKASRSPNYRPKCLQFAGALGHRFAVTVCYADETRVTLETDDEQSARNEARKHGCAAIVWKQGARERWVRA
jgi:hypothetical protein